MPGALPAGLSRTALLRGVTDGLDVVPAGANVVVAASAGPDSTALAYLVAEARVDLAVTLGHVRHGARDDTQERRLLRQHAAWLPAELVEREVAVRPAGSGWEAAARDARYTALADIAREVGASWLLIGHTADDQAETVLLRAARGTGVNGLGAMAPDRSGPGDDLRVLRPALRVRRRDLHDFLAGEGLPSAQDPTNTDDAIRRVRVRQHVLPGLAELGGDPVGALTRLADLSRDDADALDGWARDVVRREAVWAGGIVAIHDAVLRPLPAAVARRVVRWAVAAIDGPPPSAAGVARVLGLAAGERLDLPGGIRAGAGGGWRVLSPTVLPSAPPVALEIPGHTPWTPAGLWVHALTPQAAEFGDPDPADGRQIAFQLPGAWTPPRPRVDATAAPPGGAPDRLTLALAAGIGRLRLRHRAPGDRLHTVVGTRRLQDVYVDAGVPRPVRELWPVVVTDDDRVIWVPGVAVDDRVLREGRSQPAVLLVAGRDRRHRRAAAGSAPTLRRERG